MRQLDQIREQIRQATLGDEVKTITQLLAGMKVSEKQRKAIVEQAASWVKIIRTDCSPGLMESFLAEYGLSTHEGVALMCLAEAYLRVPDEETLDELIQDKITPQDFARHLGRSSSMMVNASSWGLMLTGNILSESDHHGIISVLQKLIRRAGEPLIRTTIKQMMKRMGEHFVLGKTIADAIENGQRWQDKGYRYSFDMLGEAALTQADAHRYEMAYANAIVELSRYCTGENIRTNPGISVKLSALYPRYEYLQKQAVMDNLLPVIRSLCLLAKKVGIGLNIDAEEAERLDLSLDIIQALLADPSLRDWHGLGVVVQAYSYRAPWILDWLYSTAQQHNTFLMVRLVKGAYWDREIKRSQELGLIGYPVYTRKNNTDLSYWYCAQKLLKQRDRIFPQFATHNAHTVAAILEMTRDEDSAAHSYEFQRLHGMGEDLHELVRTQHQAPVRIYAPVGVHRDLLAYLVRRLLENGANASFVHLLLDTAIPPREVVADPMNIAHKWLLHPTSGVVPPNSLFQPERMNSKGFDWQSTLDIAAIEAMRMPFANKQWVAAPLIAPTNSAAIPAGEALPVCDPATGEQVGQITEASLAQLEQAIVSATKAQPAWHRLGSIEREKYLLQAADLFEAQAGEIVALLAREAGKTIQDAIAELREAVDFLRYYAARSEYIADPRQPLGVVACISPWNFPLAIFTAQLSAALAVGNAVLVKPAQATPLIAHLAVNLMHQAGVPADVLQFVPGKGSEIGMALSSHPSISGLVFTGSLATAKQIEAALCAEENHEAVLIAETGGLNAMMVDSSALPEQAVNDIMTAAFRSAGQRCSALRIVYVQTDIAERVMEMLKGAMAMLKLGNPWMLDSDLGPVIDAQAQMSIQAYIERHREAVLTQVSAPDQGCYVSPTLIQVQGIADLTHEVFGPVLHVALFEAEELDQVIKEINAAGYGLTFALHTRIDSRVQRIMDTLKIGNIYVNRNQIGAVVGSQPFGGEGLSGTGPKAGGPYYVERLVRTDEDGAAKMAGFEPAGKLLDNTLAQQAAHQLLTQKPAKFEQLLPLTPELAANYAPVITACRQALKQKRRLPGPTGEENLLTLHARGLVVVASPDPDIAFRQVLQALYCGNPVMIFNTQFSVEQHKCLANCIQIFVTDEGLGIDTVREMEALACLVFTPSGEKQKELAQAYRRALAERKGPIVRFVSAVLAPMLYMVERHLCINTAAAGGNIRLIAQAK
ncbi:bifunctional proline dehydrogenase/L-glutamate gamma-semialdehyde dehydrogenase PutA [Nitrosomonas mobilis]|uniref:Bifunctional protein PutA n=1 Tax=Nitrosomonas mobilis TaxID=51642 RepID=A0A1G5SAJ6_9PROT|nr:bifunctional proline dehydrogenase/L-glutamate gamma-semialdehyde dehydrogenase PutA [Nitrosomonas mobilis]SCZ84225.1 Bifunctional protein PutA (Includes: Proline dehydrogenase; Delta-1-pyrroline-5-carboxylate dehydrogenase) [Nitrosomonas mobilis]